MSFDTIEFASPERDCILLLATKNPDRYEAIRTKALLRAAGSFANTPREAVAQVFEEILAIGPQTKTVMAELKALEKKALEKKTPPYEIIGAAKDILKKHGPSNGRKYKAASMTQHWTQLSIALAVVQPNPKPIIPEGFNLQEAIANNAVLPKANQLSASLEKKPAGTYHETRAHLRESTIEAPNWAEILGNLPKGSRMAALHLLQGSKEDPRFDKAAKSLAWPEMEGAAEAENHRLNSLLHNMPAIHSGRRMNLMKNMAIMFTPPESVTAPKMKMGARQQKWEKTLLAKLQGNISAIELVYVLNEISGKQKRLHPDSYKTICDAARAATQRAIDNKQETVGSSHATIGTKLRAFELQFERNKELARNEPVDMPNPELDEFKTEIGVLALIKKVKEGIKPNTLNRQVGKLLRSPMNAETVELIKGIADLVPAAKYWIDRKMGRENPPTPTPNPAYDTFTGGLGMPEAPIPKTGEDESTPSDPSKTGSFADIVIAATENEPLQFDKTYGANNYTLLHVAMRFNTQAAYEEAILKAKKDGTQLFLPDKNGRNPAHWCRDDKKAQLVIQHHAPVHIPSRDGKTAMQESFQIRQAYTQRQKEIAVAKVLREPTIEL